MQNYRVGQILFLIADTSKVLPIQVIEEVIRTTLEGKEKTYIIRFENLQQDFNFVCGKLSIEKIKLPHKNKTKHKHYTEYFDDETKATVAERYLDDIQYMNYKFGEW